jgi:hypothetical protein
VTLGVGFPSCSTCFVVGSSFAQPTTCAITVPRVQSSCGEPDRKEDQGFAVGQWRGVYLHRVCRFLYPTGYQKVVDRYLQPTIEWGCREEEHGHSRCSEIDVA